MVMPFRRETELLLGTGALEFAISSHEQARHADSVDARLAAAELLYDAAVGALALMRSAPQSTVMVSPATVITNSTVNVWNYA